MDSGYKPDESVTFSDLVSVFHEEAEAFIQWIRASTGTGYRGIPSLAEFYDYLITHRAIADDGKDRCLWCGNPITGRRTYFCNRTLRDLWYWRYDWSFIHDRILARDGYKCVACGSADNLEVHHRIPLSMGGSAFDDDNLITLCHNCHVKAHRKIKIRRKHRQDPSVIPRIYRMRSLEEYNKGIDPSGRRD